jgi:hypothetical protein
MRDNWDAEGEDGSEYVEGYQTNCGAFAHDILPDEMDGHEDQYEAERRGDV